MDRIKATMLLAEIKGYLTAGNPVWDVDEIAEACDMAIEALRNEINCVKCEHYTERETYTGIKGVCKMDTAHREDLIRRSDAIALVDRPVVPTGDGDYDNARDWERESIKNDLLSLPPAEPCDKDAISREGLLKSWEELSPRGRTEFDQVIMTIPALPSADPKTGHWIEVEDYNGDIHYQCDQCREEFILIDGTPEDNNYWHCPNCGSYNREVREHDT